jgi:hypothetical protein
MKAQFYVSLLLLCFALGQPMVASAEELTIAQRWNQMSATIKKTVTELWNKWMGPEDAARSVATVPTSEPVAAAAVPGSGPVAAVGATAPVSPMPTAVVGSIPTASPAASNPVAFAPATAPTPAGPAQSIPVVAGSRNSVAPNPTIKAMGASGNVAQTTPQPASASALDAIKSARQKLKTKNTFAIKNKGRIATGKLKTAKSGVPLYDFALLKKIKKVPQIDVGVESEISREDFSLPDLNLKMKTFDDVKRLNSPAPFGTKELVELSAMISKAVPPKFSPNEKTLLDGAVTHEKVQKIEIKTKEVSAIDLKPFKPMSEDEIKMLVTRILFDKDEHCPVVIGLADEISAKPQFRTEALFEVGACAKELKLNNVAFEKLAEVIRKQDPEYGARALNLLAQDLPIMYEPQFYELVKPLEGKEEYFNNKKVKNEIFYRAAKGAFRSERYKVAEKFASRVEPGSTFGASAQYVIAISQYGANEKTAAKATLEKLNASLEGSSDSVLKGLVVVELARMDFTAKKYDKALPLYAKVPKDHPLWVQALVEQGWAQLATDDFAGAIGNMYSLHSPYFKVLYQPQSFVVRTVGYLNICQYGDAYRTLSKLESDYRDWNTKLISYLSPARTPASVYETVKSYLKSKSSTDVEGLPYQLVREAARGKSFLNSQNAINEKSDEAGLFAGVREDLQKEKEGVRFRADQAKKRAQALSIKIATAVKAHGPADQITKMKNDLELEKSRSVPNHYELTILEQSQQAFARFEHDAQAHIHESQRKLMETASKALFARLKAMQAEMSRVLENNEFLRYEVFAGSGENIRYQVAGGKTAGDSRMPASIKPEKNMNWSFDGEFWEDEIGNYRSSLKNNCPKGNKPTNQAKAGDEK